jgi:hypothetical protein
VRSSSTFGARTPELVPASFGRKTLTVRFDVGSRCMATTSSLFAEEMAAAFLACRIDDGSCATSCAVPSRTPLKSKAPVVSVVARDE